MTPNANLVYQLYTKSITSVISFQISSIENAIDFQGVFLSINSAFAQNPERKKDILFALHLDTDVDRLHTSDVKEDSIHSQ